MKELILTKTSNSAVNGTKPVFIDIELHKQIKELKEETGLPITTIVNTFLRYGIDNVEIKDGE
ncbi:hypothetical protein [Levilactobacillus brevis]|uniref:hypothetical protein n=1 Tax=Levilactobacillus brevis TaxID=1580 RepID=UPI001120B682|nr:hypothetical protein [Levilactobacillus brevis]MUV40607.1 hypothetical protein [Levilactobacillus brevis]TOY76884.1 hypothetical protein DIS16_00915 [Levilactobacillus brevis]